MTPISIREARKSLGLTQTQFAALIGYNDKTAVSAVEAGTRNPSDSVIRLIRAYLEGYRPDDWPAESVVSGARSRNAPEGQSKVVS